MRFPNLSCKIEIFSSINPSEDPQKIEKAISNILPYSTIKTESTSVKANSTDLQSLEKIYETIQSKQSQRIFYRQLEKNLKNDSTWFYLNKQAAFVKKIALCEKPEESPLGPLKVVLTSTNIDRIINWLTLNKE